MTNQYTESGANSSGDPSASGAVTIAMMDALRGTRGWVKLVGILLFIGAAFTVLVAVGMTAGMGMMGSPRAGVPFGVFVFGGLIYLAIAAIYTLLGLYLVRYSAAICRLIGDGQVENMEAALEHQRKFWQLAGIMGLVMVVLSVLGIVAAIVIPFFVAR